MICLNSVVDSTHQEASEFIGFIQLPEILLNPCFEQVVYTTANPVRYYDVKTNKDNDTFFVTNETKRKDCYCHPLFQSYCFNKKNSYHFVAFSFDKYTAIKK